MKKVLGLVLVLFCLNVSAGVDYTQTDSAGWNNLTEAQKAELLKNIADKAAQNEVTAQQAKVANVVDPKKIDDWVSLGTHIGQAFGGAAREIGVAANDFVGTPVGLITMTLIVWHFMGGMILHLVGAILILVVGFGFVRWHRRYQYDHQITYDTEKRDLLGRSIRKEETVDGMSDDWKWMYWWTALFIILGAMITLFTA